jgi:transcriptional regulator with XRE-family HTH domain
MTEKEYAQVIAKNLKRIAFERDKTQAQIAQELKIHRATLSAWMNGTRTPKMSKIDMLCRYFGCKRSDIMESHSDSHIYYFDDTDQIAKTIRDNPTMRNLFDIAQKCTPDNLELIAEVLKRMK